MLMLRNIVKILLVLGIFASFGLGANEFSDAENIVSSASTSGKSVLGEGIKWATAVFLPLVCLVAGMVMGYSQQKKKAEQDQNTNKIYFVTVIAGLVGFFVYILIATIISKMLFGDTSYLFNVITTFWKNAVI
ncbi:hypothetical protein [Helicobacter fennelliae]|uniref:DUF4134 domain-containing protein n=1 Tax=Helicobacter fennelliae MRY12-0050 TaxID=1325130 RepID=T1DUQ1_9HELI|nr:hypothetical protein [Helicobacter fennelliae]GAD17842.1 hypothetical protein HFN_0657 [Helicobacter fennelliae MRY12-0050]STP07364.1 Uncharacterised protein [Helicobacter fennelliae]